MKKRLIAYSLVFLMAGFAKAGYAQLDLEKNTVLSKATFIQDALTRDPEFTTALQQYLQSKYSALSAREIADWTLSASAALNHTEATGSSSLYSTDSDSMGYVLGLQKLFLATGTRATLTHSNTLAESTSHSSGTTESSTPELTLSLTQPLLKNAFGLSDRYPVIIADLQKKSAYDDAVEAWEGRILELEQAYLTWCDAYESVRAYQAIVAEQVKLEKQVRRKYRSGVSDEKDMVQAEESLLNYQSLLIQAETTYLNECSNIAYLQAGKAVLDEAALAIMPEKTKTFDLAIKPMSETQVQGLRVMKKIAFLKEQQEYGKKVANSSKLPSLNLVGEITTKGEEEDLNGGYDTLSDHQDYSLMLQASIPLGGSTAEGNVGEADAALAEIESSLQDTQRSMRLAVLQMARQLDMMEQTNAIQKKLVAKGERKLKLDQRNYEIGRLDIYYLIDTQNSLSSARLNYIQSNIQLEKTKLEYLSTIDQLAFRYPELMEKLKP